MEKSADRVLVIDDEATIREVLNTILTSEGFQVDLAVNGEDGIEKLNTEEYSIVITDLRMPKADGIAVLKHIQARRLGCLAIMLTAHGSKESVIEAMRLRTFDFVEKPFNVEEIRHVTGRAREILGLKSENKILKRELKRSNRLENFIGTSAPMEKLFKLIRTVADSDSTVLILGESGTGKELVAKSIHYNSPRAERPLIAVNCAAIPEELLESELFGHMKGSFTGAVSNRPGRFQLADGGTIFLDEIADMSPKLQVKVLRVLQEHTFEPVGATETKKVDVRIIAATNRNLEKMVKDETFREDLFYRLNVIPLLLPALRERGEDIAVLLQHFVDRFNKQNHSRLTRFNEESLEILKSYHWPGNVRELENLVERMSILVNEGEIGPADLPEKFRERAVDGGGVGFNHFPAEGVDLNELVDRFEARLITQALERSNGVKNQAAKLLNIKRTTLVEKMKKKQIEG